MRPGGATSGSEGFLRKVASHPQLPLLCGNARQIHEAALSLGHVNPQLGRVPTIGEMLAGLASTSAVSRGVLRRLPGP